MSIDTRNTSPTTSHPPTRIKTIEDLRTHLQWAIELEHSTIPPYLCALYSLDAARNPEAAEVVQSVFVEEMLHLTLAANLLNAIGGKPVLDAPHLLPGYPRTLPHGDQSFQIELLPFGQQALENFLKIERPSRPGAPPEGERYETIGQFYQSIEGGLRDLCEALGEGAVFSGSQERQITASYSYGGSGSLVAVRDLASALQALTEIVEQGEGSGQSDIWDGDRQMFHADRNEVAHYYRFEELKLGRRYQQGDTPSSGPTGSTVDVTWHAVRPMRPNPRIVDSQPGSEVRVAQEAFNAAYCTLLNLLEQAFNGDPSMLGTATGAMFGLKAQALTLMALESDDGYTAGPTFEYVAPDERR
jgi:Ferritin-like